MTVLVEDLLADLDQLSHLLTSVQAEFWAAKVNKVRHHIKAGAYTSASVEMSGWFGGMGSLNDLIIHPTNGHKVTIEQTEALNTELQTLTSSLYHKVETHLREESSRR